MLDFVQVVSDYVGRLAGLDDDSLHWVSVAVRESVVNAIKHGNQHDIASASPSNSPPCPHRIPPELVIRVEDEGEGFDPEDIADPLAPENILKSSGRGIFLIRSFMDEVDVSGGADRGHGSAHGETGRQERRLGLTTASRQLTRTSHWPRCRRSRRTSSAIPSSYTSHPNPQFLATAVEAVVRAGEIQMARFGSDVRVDKKGAIDLVTEVDVEVERMFRALIGERFPDHDMLAEEMGQTTQRRAVSLGVRSARRHDQLRARHADLLLDGGARNRRRADRRRGLRSESQRAVHRRARRRRVAQRRADAGVAGAQTLDRLGARDRVPLRRPRRIDGHPRRSSPAFCARRARSAGSAPRRSTCAGSRPAAWTASGSRDCSAWDTMAGALIVQEAGGRVTALDGGRWMPAARQCLASNGLIHDAMLAVVPGASSVLRRGHWSAGSRSASPRLPPPAKSSRFSRVRPFGTGRASSFGHAAP